MKILVVVATPGEMKAVKEGIKSANIKMNMNIDYLCSGIGNYETIFSLENYLSHNSEPVFIRNIGVCGYWNLNNEKKSDPIQIANVVNIHTEKEMIVPPFLQIAPFRNCFSSENIILKKPNFQKEIEVKNDEMYFDMEGRGIEFVASKYKYPRLILKIPFDFIGSQTKVLFDKDDKFIKSGIENITKFLKDLPYHDYLEKILGWINYNE